MNTGLLHNQLKQYISILIIILIGIFLRIYFFSGFYGLDDAEYARISHQIANGSYTFGGYTGPETFMLRMGVNFPTALFLYVFGVNNWSIVLYPFILSILNVLLIYIFTVHLYDYRAGLIAAAIGAILPIDIFYNATKLIPDPIAAFYVSLGITLILFTVDSRIQNKSYLLFFGILAGLSFGVSWMCKASVVYLIPFCIAFMVITLRNNYNRNKTIWIGVAIASIGVLVVEMITYYNLSGDLLFRLHATEKMYGDMDDGLFSEGSRWGWPVGGSYLKAVLKRIFLIGPQMILFNINFLYIPLIGLIAVIYAFYWKEKNFLVPALWLITIVLMLNFASSSTEAYTPLALLHRYLYPTFFPALVLTGGFLAKLLFNNNSNEIKRERFYWGMVIVVFLFVIGSSEIFSSIRSKNYSRGWVSEGQKVSNILKPSDRIYTDILNIKALEFYWRYPKQMKTIDFEGMISANEIASESYILIHPTAVDWLKLNEGMWLNKGPVYDTPEFFKNIPESWKIIWTNDRATLYKVE